MKEFKRILCPVDLSESSTKMDVHFSNFPNTKTRVVAVDASEEILNYIENQHIDLVIMGTHGRKGMDKIIFGSVAERVLKASPVPVMVVNPYKTGLE